MVCKKKHNEIVQAIVNFGSLKLTKPKRSKKHNKMSQYFHNTVISYGGSQFDILLFYFILNYKKLTP